MFNRSNHYTHSSSTANTPIMKRKSSNEGASTNAGRRTKRSKTHDQFFQDQRELEDLWKHIFPVGTEWDNIHLLYKYNWNFSNLEDAFQEGGVLHEKKVYLFVCTEAQTLLFQGQPDTEITHIPAVVAVVSPFPPSNEIAVRSFQRESEEIIAMKEMKMDWVPYIPLGKRSSSVERLKSKIFMLSCVQRRAGLKHLTLDRFMKFQYCLPYIYHPFMQDETVTNTIVDILYPVEPPVVCQYDWDLDELEDFTNDVISSEELSEDHRDAFMKFVDEKVKERKKTNCEERKKRRNAIEKLSETEVAAFKEMRFYKFYPVATTDTPEVPKASYINRYYGKAHQVF